MRGSSPWDHVPLGSVAETALGKMLDRGATRGLASVPYLRNVNVQWGRIDTDDVLSMELSTDEHDRFGLRTGDLLVCEGGEIGRAAIWTGTTSYMAYQKALHRVRPGNRLDARFLRYYLQYAAQVGALDALATGSTIRHLPQQQLRRLGIPLPPMQEQRRIVDVLEDHLSRLSAGDSALASSASRLQSLATSWHHSVFSTAADRMRPLTDVVAIENGQTPKGLLERLRRTESDTSVPYFKVGDMNGGEEFKMASPRFFVAREDAADLRLHIRRRGSVLIPKRGGAIATNKKRLLEVDAAYDLNTMGLRPHSVTLEYLLAWLDGIDLGAIADGSNVPQINASQIQRLSIPVPDAATQAEIADSHRAMSDSASRLQIAIDHASRRSTSLHRALLSAAFLGKLTGAASDYERIEELATVT